MDYTNNLSPGRHRDVQIIQHHEPSVHLPVSPLSVTDSPSHKRTTVSTTGMTYDNPSKQGPEPEITPYEAYPSRQEPPVIRYRIFRRWKWELGTLILALGIFLAIVIILKEFNGQSVPDWGHSINLSTLLALLATLFRSAIVAIMAQIISQSKWAGFLTGTAYRPLQLLQDYDSASRNALGAAALIPKALKHDLLATLAAVVTVVSLAVGPIVQQAVRTSQCARPRVVDTSTVQIPYARFVPRERGFERNAFNDQWELLDEARDGLHMSLIRPDAAERKVDTQIRCSTGNCTFPGGDPIDDGGNNEYTGEPLSSYTTVGVCSKCVDIKSLIKVEFSKSNNSNGYTLPNGLYVGMQQAGEAKLFDIDMRNRNESMYLPTRDIDWAGDLVPPEAAWSFANLTILAATFTTCAPNANGHIIPDSCMIPDSKFGTGIIATTCAIYPCMRTYTSSVLNGEFRETLLTTTPLVPAYVSGMRTPSIPPINSTTTPGALEFDPLSLKSTIYPRAAIKSPCRSSTTPSQIYTLETMHQAPNTTTLHLASTPSLLPNGNYPATAVSAPAECIYMHAAGLATGINMRLSQILQGNCSHHMVKPKQRASCRTLLPGLDGWVYQLYRNRTADQPSIEAWVGGFAGAMTDLYRMEMGSGEWDADVDPREVGERGVVGGVVWRSERCTEVRWGWVGLPGGLAVMAVVLLGWMVGRSWVRRGREPVWKDGVWSGVMYRGRFETREGAVVGEMGGGGGGGGYQVGLGGGGGRGEGEGGRLAETEEMERIAKGMLVTFRLPGRDGKGFGVKEQMHVSGSDTGADGNWPAQRRPRRLSLDSLMTPVQ